MAKLLAWAKQNVVLCIAACAVAIVPTIFQGKFKKWQGYALLAIYALYMLLLILNETGVVALG